jgi:excisionase family DNA binding protein
MTTRTALESDPLIDAKQAAKLLNISPTKIKRMAQAGQVPAIQIGNYWKFRASWLESWLNSRVPSAASPVIDQLKSEVAALRKEVADLERKTAARKR